jgi:HD-GYP domain-containing protein (c-di-GMP phosphodiesterase class II)
VAWDDIPEWALKTANCILQTVKEKDPHTFFHCCRVGRGSRQLARAMGLNEFEQSVLEFSGLFHDIGKVGIPDNILLKPGRLDPAEIDIMKAHPVKSAAIIAPLSDNAFFRFLMPGVRYHHERIDGTGYPFGLAGERIPLPAKVIAVIDSYDAMSNVRPYRKPLSHDKVIKELKDFSGRQFDANLVKIFLEILPSIVKQKPDQLENDELVIARILKAA